MENAGKSPDILTARAAGLVGCTHCGTVHQPDVHTCTRCGSTLVSRDATSLQKVWAWWAAGLLVYVPANLYPMLITDSLGTTTASTILGGVIDLVHHGSWGIATIVFVASICIPVAKFIAVAYLALGIKRRLRLSLERRHVLFEVVEFVGRWSMIGGFLVGIRSSIVQLDFAASIHPGIAAVSFALSVAFTMLSAQSFDPRLIWDANEDDTA